MSGVDTSAAAVERLANHAHKLLMGTTIDAPLLATLRALAAERDAAVQERNDAEGDMCLARHSLVEVKTDRDRLAAEVERIKAAWLFVIQAENSCAVFGVPCRGGGKCGCAAEQEMLLREHDERAALATKEPGA
jgi:hypothetical protein